MGIQYEYDLKSTFGGTVALYDKYDHIVSHPTKNKSD
jgi:hypothetical protein